MGTKIWNLKYVAGNTGRLFADASNPQRRAEALAAASQVAANGWRAWVEHHKTGARIFESDREREHQRAEFAKRIIQFAVNNVPGYAPDLRK